MILLPVTSTAQPECGASVTPSHTRSGTRIVVVTGAPGCRTRACAGAMDGTVAAAAPSNTVRKLKRITCSVADGSRNLSVRLTLDVFKSSFGYGSSDKE